MGHVTCYCSYHREVTAVLGQRQNGRSTCSREERGRGRGLSRWGRQGIRLYLESKRGRKEETQRRSQFCFEVLVGSKDSWYIMLSGTDRRSGQKQGVYCRTGAVRVGGDLFPKAVAWVGGVPLWVTLPGQQILGKTILSLGRQFWKIVQSKALKFFWDKHRSSHLKIELMFWLWEAVTGVSLKNLDNIKNTKE